jgi:uncharacterized protein YndB with AHSA1/START domain
MGDSVSVSKDIAAPPDKVWAMIADLPRMGEWSPENTGGSWLGGASGPAVGVRFKGTNANGWHKWSTVATVKDCEPGRRFSFSVVAAGFKEEQWSYELEPEGEGCRVTERWDDHRGRLAKTLGTPLSGSDHGVAHTRAGIETTLTNLAQAAEAIS